MKTFLYYTLMVSMALLFVLMMILGGTGCTPIHPTTTVVPIHSVTTTPTSLTGVATGLNWLIIGGVLAVGAGLALFFFVPEAHNLSIPIAAVGGGIEVAALVTRVSLWFIPWLAGGLALLALVFFAYEVYRNRSKLLDDYDAYFGGTVTDPTAPKPLA